MSKFKFWLRAWLGLDKVVENWDKRLSAIEKLVKDRTTAGVDIHHNSKDGDYVVMVGRYAGRDYVQAFRMAPDEFSATVDRLRSIERHSHLRYIDCHPEFRAVLKRELDR